MAPRADLPVLDGHNDTLLRLHVNGLPERAFFQPGREGHLDLPRARAGGLGGGFFAVFVPPPEPGATGSRQAAATQDGYAVPYAPAIDPGYALRTAMALTARLFRIEAASEGQVRVVRSADELAGCLARGVFAMILHFEGAEAIDPDLHALEVFYRAGLRSLGIVWSRPNAFGYGVPFRFPHAPDIGPGLTEAGRALVRACNRLGILIDLAHLNERGFWDVAALSEAPLVVTHAAVHALSPSSRNLTDRQLDAIGASGGVVGLNFSVYDLRADGRRVEETPLEVLVRHIDYIRDRIGIDHVAFGSDFDGTVIPRALGDAAGLPRLLEALRAAGYDAAALRKLAYENWLRVLRATWK
ncbi:dipeptidase [Rhodocaloribacter litoris]|uniref:dipeptidase n=1 Tax=Rhodocaloribacter litoris TaxID=2558931 RepID=UPI00141E0844|nr:dipeptidase [Rhodocaloribacter litoris]QXD15597.1 dipeptidase [Rhodocaloribacter litoris]GIV60901.1 MAG: membrane dipeptidase [Rhodothermaceae bacterium]